MATQLFTIETASIELLRDYVSYCDAKAEIDEIPLSFDQWQQFNETSQ